MDLIERQTVIEAIAYSIELCNKALDSMTLGGRDRYAVEVERNSLLKLKDDFKLLPSAQPEHREKGKWIPVTRIEEWNKEDDLTGFPPEVAVFPNCTIKYVDATEPDEVDAVRCSECGTVYDFTEARNWCSECGADMRGEK